MVHFLIILAALLGSSNACNVNSPNCKLLVILFIYKIILSNGQFEIGLRYKGLLFSARFPKLYPKPVACSFLYYR